MKIKRATFTSSAMGGVNYARVPEDVRAIEVGLLNGVIPGIFLYPKTGLPCFKPDSQIAELVVEDEPELEANPVDPSHAAMSDTHEIKRPRGRPPKDRATA